MVLQESKRRYSKNECGIYRPEPLNYHPIRKPLHFDPQPVAGNIPFYADIQRNPACENTQSCIDFWEEQFNYCINGYTTAGIFIPGRYYFFLNFRIIRGNLGEQYPWFIDAQYEYMLLFEWVKHNKWMGVIAPKARRKGLSELGVNILEHGVRFINSYKGGICAGLATYVDIFKGKMDIAHQEIRPEMKMSTLTDNTKEIEYGYKVRNILGNIEDDGSRGKILMATMYDDPKKFEGEYFNDVICEESGEFPLLESTVESIKPAMMMGSEVGGSFLLYGTGGNILSSSRGFKAMYDQSESLKLARFEVLGHRANYPNIGLSKGSQERYFKKNGKKLNQETPNFDGWKDYEKVGCEDIIAAEQWIISEDERYQSLGDRKKLRENRQNFPRSVDDIFTSAGKNNFDSDILYYALNVTMQEMVLQQEGIFYEKMVLDFTKEKDQFGVFKIKFPLSVTCRSWTEKDPEWKIVYILNGQTPSPIRNLDAGGTDAYEADETQTSGSKMGICVLRDYKFAPGLCPFPKKNAILPICLYYDRPPRRDLAFEMSLKISVYWNLERNMMVSAEHESCMAFFKNNYGTKYLSLRPKTLDSSSSQQIHKYGLKATLYSKPRILALAQDYVSDWGEYFRSEFLIRDFLAYDEENIGTDWDLADACMSAIVRIHDRKAKVPDPANEENEGIDGNTEISYYYDSKGELCFKQPAQSRRTRKIEPDPEPECDYMIG